MNGGREIRHLRVFLGALHGAVCDRTAVVDRNVVQQAPGGFHVGCIGSQHRHGPQQQHETTNHRCHSKSLCGGVRVTPVLGDRDVPQERNSPAGGWWRRKNERKEERRGGRGGGGKGGDRWAVEKKKK